jgi:hypothetical protein
MCEEIDQSPRWLVTALDGRLATEAPLSLESVCGCDVKKTNSFVKQPNEQNAAFCETAKSSSFS